MRRGLLHVATAALLVTGACSGNPVHEPTPMPGPPVTTGTPSHPRGVEVTLR
jgi:hypothetical protein